ncbi:MAG: DNA-methyltransferase [Thermodesulfobacteriota bacterium]
MNHPEVSIFNQDCIPGMAERLAEGSVNCCITSIPFGSLFSYSHKTDDIGNNQDGAHLHAGQFGLHMRFFIEQLYRVMAPGGIACIHIQQLLRYKVQHGYMGMRDFRGSCYLLFEAHGFQPHGEVAIPKNPQAVARRLNLHSLMFATAYRDSRALAPAMNDYVLFFRKPGDGQAVKGIIEADRSVKLVEPSPIIRYLHNGAVKRVAPDFKTTPYRITTWNETTGEVREATATGGKGINPDGWFTKDDWIRWARGCWDDILEIDTLDGWRCARDSQEEKHVCPLQLEVIRRCMKLYSAPGDLILDPFMGIGSTAYVAVEQGRDCVGFELKESYHRMALANVVKAREVFADDGGDALPLFREAV